jgi:hypothetical protein
MPSKSVMPILAFLLVFSTGMALAQEAGTATPKETHAVAGDLEKVGADGKTITVKTADGTEEVFKVSGKAVANGTKEGSHVVVHYTEEGGEKTASRLKDAGKGTWKATECTVTAVGKGGRDVTVKTADGSEKVFHLGKEATVETEHGVVDASKYTAKAGDKVVVYSTVEPGKEVVHLFKKL